MLPKTPIYRDFRSDRKYLIDEATGQRIWLEEQEVKAYLRRSNYKAIWL